MTFTPGHGDITGARYQAALARKAEVPDAVRATINALHEENVELVKIPHGRTLAIPKEAADAIRQQMKEGSR